MKVIYDFGAHRAEDIPYYLKKADKVVAVEANPDLCKAMRERFASDIASGQLVIENCALSNEFKGEDREVDFYISKTTVLSQLDPPDAGQEDSFSVIRIPARHIVDLIAEHGDPYYIKIDLEGFDAKVVRELFRNDITPPYLSAECHTVEVAGLLLSSDIYHAFKLIDGKKVETEYADHPIETADGRETYTFPMHAAGPFGNDISGPWHTGADMMTKIVIERPGWKDLHASRIDVPASGKRTSSYSSLLKFFLRNYVMKDVPVTSKLKAPYARLRGWMARRG